MSFELAQIGGCKDLPEKIKPFRPWGYKNDVKVYDEEKFEENKENAEVLVYHIEQCCSTGTLIKRDIFDLCFQLSAIFNLCGSIEVLGAEDTSATYPDKRCSFNYKPSARIQIAVCVYRKISACLFFDLPILLIPN